MHSIKKKLLLFFLNSVYTSPSALWLQEGGSVVGRRQNKYHYAIYGQITYFPRDMGTHNKSYTNSLPCHHPYDRKLVRPLVKTKKKIILLTILIIFNGLSLKGVII